MSRKMRNKIAAFLLPLAVMLGVTPAYATEVDSKNDKVTTDLKKGEKAPFDGILLSLRLAAEVKENCAPETIEKRCQVRIDEAKKLANSECTQKTDVLKVEVSACQEKHVKVVAAKDEYISVLESKLPKWYESPKLWFGIGIVVGGGVVIAVARNVN